MDKYRFNELQPSVQDVVAWFLEQEREVWRSFILNGHPRARPLYELYNNSKLSADDAGSFVMQLCNLLDKQEAELTRLQRIEAAARAFIEIELELDASQSYGEDITTEQHNDKVDKWNELCDALIEHKKAEE